VHFFGGGGGGLQCKHTGRHRNSQEQLRKLFRECDTNGDGVLDIQEFTKGCENKYLIKWAHLIQINSLLSFPEPYGDNRSMSI
jgi:hypothetical protein